MLKDRFHQQTGVEPSGQSDCCCDVEVGQVPSAAGVEPSGHVTGCCSWEGGGGQVPSAARC